MQLQTSTWNHDIEDCGEIPHHIVDWLTIPQKLTQSIRSRCHQFDVIVHHENVQIANEDEQFQLNTDKVFIREVSLCGNGEPWVYGRVVMPFQAYMLHHHKVSAVGKQPFGEALLYRDPKICRDPFEFASLDANHPIMKRITDLIGPQTDKLWARRSLFHLTDILALVTDVFLCNIPHYNESC